MLSTYDMNFIFSFFGKNLYLHINSECRGSIFSNRYQILIINMLHQCTLLQLREVWVDVAFFVSLVCCILSVLPEFYFKKHRQRTPRRTIQFHLQIYRWCIVSETHKICRVFRLHLSTWTWNKGNNGDCSLLLILGLLSLHWQWKAYY